MLVYFIRLMERQLNLLEIKNESVIIRYKIKFDNIFIFNIMILSCDVIRINNIDFIIEE